MVVWLVIAELVIFRPRGALWWVERLVQGS
jgi:hypothetical protein